MDFKEKEILILSFTKPMPGIFRLWEESPDDCDFVQLQLSFDGREIIKIENDFFSAMCEIRKEIEDDGLLIKCFGTAENVYPSPMLQNMGDGRKAYRLTLAIPAKTADIVDIFENGENLNHVTVQKQAGFYEKWLKSLGV